MVKPDDVRLSGADLSTVETLVQELAHPEPGRVIYAIDVLESLDKRNLVTPLLLYHESPKVRARALSALGAVRSDIARQWTPQIRRMLGDPESSVRAAAIGALVAISQEDAASLSRPLLQGPRCRESARPRRSRWRAVPARPMSMPRKPHLLELASDSREDARRSHGATSPSRFDRLPTRGSAIC